MKLRRWAQLISLGLFLYLLAAAGMGAVYLLPEDIFLRLDPIFAPATALSARVLSVAFIPGLVVLFLGPVLGRAFCGWVCPMGTTVDEGDALFAPKKKQPGFPRLRPLKYLVLAFILGSAAFGVSLVFLASPLSLITRFYGLVIIPIVEHLAEAGLSLIQPLAEYFNWHSLALAQVKPGRFATGWFIVIFFAGVFACARFSPRFWCRYLCPSGALLGLLSKRPLVRRRVSEACNGCAKCQRACPMDAIEDEFIGTRNQDCQLCRTCQDVCPENAISFLPGTPVQITQPAPFSASRRQVIASGLGGAGAALVTLSGLDHPQAVPGPGQIRPAGLIRPPAALPEAQFLDRCHRCGQCISVCPTNTLQPIWLKAGFSGLFSPAITPRRAGCAPHCHRCAEVCPSRAMGRIGKNERLWAKMGTARVIRQKCLAWEHQKKCMVCDEVCPYGAIEFRNTDQSKAPVPLVSEDKCAGCGYCEHFCPVQNQAAIVVIAQGALRLEKGSYEAAARKQGLKISLRPKKGYPKKVEPKGGSGLPPGFTK